MVGVAALAVADSSANGLVVQSCARLADINSHRSYWITTIANKAEAQMRSTETTNILRCFGCGRQKEHEHASDCMWVIRI